MTALNDITMLQDLSRKIIWIEDPDNGHAPCLISFPYK
jgi:hypothetical protein